MAQTAGVAALGAASGFSSHRLMTIGSKDMADQWYYAHQGQQSGPVSIEQLKQLAASGQLQPGDLVWKQGMAAWAAANTVEGVFSAAGSPAPPPPGAAPGAPGIPPQPGAAPGYSVAMRFTLPSFNVGAWIILGATLLVVVSLFFKWTGVPGRAMLRELAQGLGMGNMPTDIPGDSYASHMGLINPWVMFTGVFIYPVWMLLAGRPIHLVGGILCGAWGALTALFWILKYGSAANWGLYVYLVSCLALIVGVILYKPTGWRLFR
jgi:hypothetical protein